jgi:hypothetical protein
MPMEEKETSKVGFDPNALAVQYYFGDLQYWKLPQICVEALEHGFDGRTLRILAGLANPVAADIRGDEIEEAFREMEVNAPISKDEARLALAMEAGWKLPAGGCLANRICLTRQRTSEYIFANGIKPHVSCSLSLRFPKSPNTRHAGNGSNSNDNFVTQCRSS